MTDEPETLACVSPQTRALSLYIQQAITRLRHRSPNATNRPDEDPPGNLIFFGNWQDPFPRLLVTDPILEPVDKVVWQIIRTHVTAPGTVTAFPNYESIRAGANVKSNHTVSRAITILRATRWLSLCERVRDTQGRFLGNIYALHDEPITLGDAMFLDGDYIEFLRHSENHKHLRVGRVAHSVLATIQDMIDAGEDAVGERVQTWTYERRIALFAEKRKEPNLQLCAPNPFYAVSDPYIAALSEQIPEAECASPALERDDGADTSHVQKTHTAENEDNNPVQNLHTDANFASPPLQKMHTAIYSSSNNNNININTTTTNKHPCAVAKSSASLHFPPGISGNERNLARMYLKSIDESLQQTVLDEWQGRLKTGNRRGEPIDNPIGYLAVLCQRAKVGTFQLTIGLRIRETREHEQNHRQRLAETENHNHLKALARLEKYAGNDSSRHAKQLEGIRRRHGRGKDPPED